MDDVEREKVLDVFCSHYYDLKLLCSDYDMCLPESGDLGYVRNYLNDNLDKVLFCIDCCYCGEVVEKIKSITRKVKNGENYGKNPY